MQLLLRCLLSVQLLRERWVFVEVFLKENYSHQFLYIFVPFLCCWMCDVLDSLLLRTFLLSFNYSGSRLLKREK